MKYQVPQFIEVEDKIFGPFTLKQFIYLAGGAGLALVFYSILPLFLAVVPMAAAVGIGAALAFYKVNNKPFINLLESATKYLMTPKLYVWKKETKPITPEKRETENPSAFIPSLGNSKLKDLTWSLDVKNTSSIPNSKDKELV